MRIGVSTPQSCLQLLTSYSSVSRPFQVNLNRSSTLQVQHTAAQSPIPAFESKVPSLETLIKSQTASIAPPQPPQLEPTPLSSESFSQILSIWKKSVEGQWSTVREERASERERLAFAREEWENKANSVETNLGSTAAKFESGLASLAVLECQQQQTQSFLVGLVATTHHISGLSNQQFPFSTDRPLPVDLLYTLFLAYIISSSHT